MGKWQRGFVFACLMAVPAAAEPASDAAIGSFVDNHSAISRLGKIARWEDGVCPNVTGLPANFAKFIAKRIRDVATAAGAPVNADENCKPNIDIVFTTKPQGLLDSIRTKDPVLLGYYDNTSQADEMAKVTRVIQAWHATQTVDTRGHALVDSRNNASGGAAQSSNAQNSFGNRLGDGLHSSYYHAIIVADPGKLGDYEIGTLADHIAMLALAQPAADDDLRRPAQHPGYDQRPVPQGCARQDDDRRRYRLSARSLPSRSRRKPAHPEGRHCLSYQGRAGRAIEPAVAMRRLGRPGPGM